jgi:hypothetical protein
LFSLNKFQGPGKFFVPLLKVPNPLREQIRRGVLTPLVKSADQLRQLPRVAPVMLRHILQKGLCLGAAGGMPGLVDMTMGVIVGIVLSFSHIKLLSKRYNPAEGPFNSGA